MKLARRDEPLAIDIRRSERKRIMTATKTKVKKVAKAKKIKTVPEIKPQVKNLGGLLAALLAKHGPFKLEISYATGSHFSYLVEEAFDNFCRCKGGILISLGNAAHMRIVDKKILASLMELTDG